MSAHPLVSVITPVHNGARYLSEAIESIERQRYEPIEILVVDDGSTDDTPRVISGFGDRVRAFRQDNAGPAAARNHAMDAARGEIFAFCDADDLWPDGKLQSQVARLEQDDALDVLLGRIQYVAADDAVLPEVQFEDQDLKTLTHVHLGSGVYRRRAFERIGPFDDSLRYSEDVDWFFRAREAGLNIRISPQVTLIYRIHGSNMTRGMRPEQFDLTRIMKRSLERRRAAGREGESLPRWRDLDDVQPGGGSDTTGEPTVSVIIPVFNDTRYLDEAIDSALAQTHRPFEVIVIDDGSEPPIELSDRPGGRVRFARVRHGGQGAARNIAAHHTRGDVLAFLDADDVWLPDKLERQVAVLVDDPAVDMVFGGVEEFVSPELEAADLAVAVHAEHRAGGLPSAFVVRRRSFNRVGGFRDDVVIGEFVDWYSRAKEKGLREARVDDVVVRRRIHDRNTGIVERDRRTQYARVLKDALDRRRGTGVAPGETSPGATPA
jgi:glycosyltransferase involved in cell wall biosynthesis